MHHQQQQQQQSIIPKQCVDRLHREYLQLCHSPHPNFSARPMENNLLDWRFVLHSIGQDAHNNSNSSRNDAGNDDESSRSVFSGGFYYGKVIFPPSYPHRPPALYMITPNGRFVTGSRLCLSMSDCTLFEITSFSFATHTHTYIFTLTHTRMHQYIYIYIYTVHPESWNPMWSVSTIILGLLSFMVRKF